MKILSNKHYNKLKSNEKINYALGNSFRANMLSLSFERAIVQILKQYNLRELEIPKSYIMNDETLNVCENLEKDTITIRIESKGE